MFPTQLTGKKYIKIAIIFCAALLLTCAVFYFGLLDIWQEKLFDKFFSKKSPSQEIIIFAIDNESIAKVGQWPWQRSVFADAIEKLQSAKVIAIDVNFSEPDSQNPDSDLLLAKALQTSMPNIILPLQIDSKTKEVTQPLSLFSDYSLLGNVSITNEDGTARTIKNIDENTISFAARIAKELNPQLHIPDTMRIAYAGPQKTFLTLPMIDLLENRVPENIYQDKVAIIGATAPDLHDTFQTPFGLLSGAEIHANAAATILSQRFYQKLPSSFAFILIFLCNLLALVIVIKIKKIFWLLLSLAGTLCLITIASIVFFLYRIILPVLYLDLSFVTLSAALIILQYLTASEEKKFIYNSFKYYLSPEVINEIIADPSKLKLGGERKKVTILFSDIRGFTTISERMTPENLTKMLNEYFTVMTDIVMDNKGFVNRYIGDAIMGIWGTPLVNATQAQDACRSAVKMMQALQTLNQQWKLAGKFEEITVGLGINTGQVVVGNVGSKKRFNYDVIGDEANFAARLEGLTKSYGVKIIISESTKNEIQQYLEFTFRELDTIMVKGKKEPKTIFELLVAPLDKKIPEHFSTGQHYYKKGDFAKAIEHFSLAADYDGPSKTYLERCKEFLVH